MDAYSLSALRAKKSIPTFAKAANLSEAKARQFKTAFLCHSHKDRDEALVIKALIESQGDELYIDWLDTEMTESPTKETAERLKARIVACDRFLFLATPNSVSSKWCPWELGVADGRKGVDAIAIIPTKDDAGRYYGNEYMHLYKRIEPSAVSVSSHQLGAPIAINPGEVYGKSMSQL